MKIHLLAVGSRMDRWVVEGYEEYAKRLPPHCRLILIEIPAGKRTKNTDLDRLMVQEGELLLNAIPEGALCIALDRTGKQWSTEQLSTEMDRWLQGGRDVALLVGGPEGLSPACVSRAEQRWSLSTLTLPHPLVRIVVAEQLFRAWSILSNHPYHR